MSRGLTVCSAICMSGLLQTAVWCWVLRVALELGCARLGFAVSLSCMLAGMREVGTVEPEHALSARLLVVVSESFAVGGKRALSSLAGNSVRRVELVMDWGGGRLAMC